MQDAALRALQRSLHRLGRSAETLVSRHRSQRRHDLHGPQSARRPWPMSATWPTSTRSICLRATTPRPDPEQTLIALEDGERLRQAIAGLALALPRDARDARRQRPLLSRDRRSDRGAGRHGDVAAGARPRHARQDLEGRAMTDRDASERLLKLNAALDGELDAMASLEFEREMRDDPALAAEYRRLAALRDAIRRHAPREAAPQALADRIAAMAGVVVLRPTRPPQRRSYRFARRAWLDRRALALAASFAVLGFAVGAGLTSLRSASAFGRRRPKPGRGFCPRRDRRPAIRRRFLRPAHGQAMARPARDAERRDRRPRSSGLHARGRAHRRRRSNPGPDARLSQAQASDRSDRAAARLHGRRATAATGSRPSTAFTSPAGRTRT